MKGEKISTAGYGSIGLEMSMSLENDEWIVTHITMNWEKINCL